MKTTHKHWYFRAVAVMALLLEVAAIYGYVYRYLTIGPFVLLVVANLCVLVVCLIHLRKPKS